MRGSDSELMEVRGRIPCIFLRAQAAAREASPRVGSSSGRTLTLCGRARDLSAGPTPKQMPNGEIGHEEAILITGNTPGRRTEMSMS